MTTDLESRIRQLEDRALISERVIKYAMAVDRADWEMFADCFTDPVHADYSENGMPAADFARDDLVGIVRGALGGYTATQHLSTNTSSSSTRTIRTGRSATRICTRSTTVRAPRAGSSCFAARTPTTCSAHRMAGVSRV